MEWMGEEDPALTSKEKQAAFDANDNIIFYLNNPTIDCSMSDV
jgi:hypothetical protein